MKVEMIGIDKIKPYGTNPRKIPPEAVDKVAASLKEYGFRQPIVVDGDFVIVAGHTRFAAAKKLGMTEVPVHVAVGLTPEQVKAYRIADNKTNEFAVWDDVLLKGELEALRDANFDAALTGFDGEDLVKALLGKEEFTVGAKELGAEDFSTFKHRCPRCGFEYDKDMNKGAADAG